MTLTKMKHRVAATEFSRWMAERRRNATDGAAKRVHELGGGEVIQEDCRVPGAMPTDVFGRGHVSSEES
jgi:hypothetical protein